MSAATIFGTIFACLAAACFFADVWMFVTNKGLIRGMFKSFVKPLEGYANLAYDYHVLSRIFLLFIAGTLFSVLAGICL